MKKTQHPVAKPLSLAVAAALTGLGLAMTLVAPVQATPTIVSGSQGTITNTTTQDITITNTGTISGGANAINNNAGTIGTLSNSGTISGGNAAGINTDNGAINVLINNGTISAVGYGVEAGLIGTLTNSGTIIGYTGIGTGGTVGTIVNNGAILSNSTGPALANYGGFIGILNNSGTISASHDAILNSGSIASLSNTGTISAGNGYHDINNSGTINALSNGGRIFGGNTGVASSGTIGLLSNSGSIVGGTYGVKSSGIIGTLSNGGLISGGSGVFNSGTIGALSNGGSISAVNYYAIDNGVSGFIGTLSNGFRISGTDCGIVNSGTVSIINNSGTITGVSYSAIDNSGVINVLNNSHSISGGSAGVYNVGTIGTLSNIGTISAGGGSYDINNNGGTIVTLTNGQSNLTYTGHFPTDYNTYFASGSSYGTAVFVAASGAITTYGIQLAPSGVTLAPGTYSTVLSSPSSGFSVSNYNTILTYSANGYLVTYELVAGVGHTYDLDILSFSCSGNCASSSNSNSNNSASGIGAAVRAEHNNPAYYAARVIDANNTLSNLFSGVSGTAAQSAAASQSLPLVTGGATSVTQTALTSVNTIIDARQSANRGASSGDDFQTNRSMWMKAFGTEADQSDLDGVSGFKAHTGGITFGADQKINDKLTLGAAFAYANSNVSSTVGGASQGINIKGYQLIGYGSLALNNRDSLDFQLDGGMSNNSGSRDISFADVVASSSYNSWSAHLGSSLNRRYDLSDRLTLTPSLRVDYTRINESGYQESGAGDLDLNVNSQKAEALVFGVDGKLDYKLSDTLAVAANLGVGYDAMHKQDSIVAAYAGAASASFVTEGLNQGALISRAGVVLSYKLPKGMEVSAHYDMEGRRNYLSQTASVKFSMPF